MKSGSFLRSQSIESLHYPIRRIRSCDVNTMEDDQIFEAEADLEANELEGMRSGNKDSSDVSVKAMVTANDGYHKRLASSTAEESPLLPSGSSNERREGSGGD